MIKRKHMKSRILLTSKITVPSLIFVFAAAVHALPQSKSMTEKDFAKLTFLEGDWVRQGTPPDREGYERWTKVSATEMQGTGVSIKNGDTLFVEKLQLILNDGKIFYVADVAENQAPVKFSVSSIDDNGFVSENPAHDFPRKIAYRLTGDSLLAQISGDGKTFDYLFKRKR